MVRSPTFTCCSFGDHPDREHDDHDGDELQKHAQPHQLLRGVCRTTTHHVDEAEQQHHRNRADGDGDEIMREKPGHGCYLERIRTGFNRSMTVHFQSRATAAAQQEARKGGRLSPPVCVKGMVRAY